MNETTTFTAEQAEVVAVIERESAAWLRGDLAGWRDCWVQDAHVQHVIARPSVGARIMYGIDEMEAYLAPEFEAIRAHPPPNANIRRENWRITVGTDMAWATFDQVRPADEAVNTAPGRHNQMRILERHDGRWKIAAIFQIPNRIGYYASPWVQVDRSGRVIQLGLGAKAALSAHRSLQLVGDRLVARQQPAGDRLKAVLQRAHEHIMARRGQPPVPLVLSEDEDSALSLCWVTIADMMIVVLLGDESLLRRAIETAGDVYHLSASQMRVAEAIARGLDLTEVAAELGVRPNTVRTHVRRMFERVEVNSQPALMRALLSVEAPFPSRLAPSHG